MASPKPSKKAPKRAPKKRKLNPSQRRFAVEYLKDQNATQAYLRVYGGSAESAGTAGPRLLENVAIQVIVERGLARAAERANITAEKNLARIAGIAYENKLAKLPTVLKACELIGRALGQFKDISQVTATVEVVDQAAVKAMREKIKSDC